MIKRISEKFTPKQYIFKFFAILTALLGLYLLVAWSSYSPLDNSWVSSASHQQTINKAGPFGAWIIDLFFVLFGYVGHLFPFMIFILPLAWLRKKSEMEFSWAKFALRFLGLSIFLSGTCVLFTLLFSHNPYYLSGGVLGGSIVTALFSLLDFVGLMLSGFVFAVVGFVLCSGSSLIQWLVKAYYWLTMQNEEKSQQEESKENQEESTTEQIEFELGSEVATENIESQKVVANAETPMQPIITKPVEATVRSEPLINIEGLERLDSQKNSVESSTNQFDDVNAVQLGGYVAGQEEQLPTVSMVAPPSLHDELATSPEWKNTRLSAIEELPIETQTVNLQDDLAPIPTVSLSPLAEKTQSEMTALESEDNEIESDLARQFALQEQQRLNEMAMRAKELDAEEVLDHILDKNDEKTVQSSIYKPYGDSLIHPALQQQVTIKAKPTTPMPSLDLLEHRPAQAHRVTQEEIRETSQRIEHQLRNFNVKATVKGVLVGPVVTRYELELQPGVKAARVTGIDTDLARALMFRSIRVAEVIPGKPYIGIETPNDHRQMVTLREVLDSDEFRQSKSLLSMALGKDISGHPVVVDLAKMPHLLVAGSTGSGKSVGVNTMILSLLFRVKPEEVKFIMIDPKVVELSIYNGIPHLLTEVVTDMKKAANALRWCVDEMERRYQLLSVLRMRNIEGYNEKIDEYEALNMPIPNPLWRPGDTMDALPPPLEKLSYIVVVVDEFADLMMVAGKQVEELIARLAQKARAIGIHLILATQRPSVDVITGLIKANIPSRIAFTVASKIDSRTILDQVGAEALLGRGDMLYSGAGSSDLVRVHGAFMSDDEVARVVDDWKARGKPNYIESILDGSEEDENESSRSVSDSDELDDLFDEVSAFVIDTGITSISSIQRKFKVGFNRAARIMEQLEEQGIVSSMQNGKRDVLARRSSDF
ncbi:DNA translocase FtsK [Pasteurella dagmatis]|uniref:DNA translocase FtsK n=1 Tax=Pasteurella dagmatis ATCC 43325 TaxID=667128 RepID=C9PQN7_9PAST|nr:DNA translocase FtsK [Pasteurella dagmatis]EEX50159.1 FtsK/SpoIIIE family protein [Pasteurella dagmatis ATCC 43325]SNV57968.1 DNA translocase FtsK [Pasteurella dagmatis]